MKKDTLLTLALILIGLSIVVFTGTGCSTDNIGAGTSSVNMSDADKTAYESATRPEVILPEGLSLVTGLSGKTTPTTDTNLDDPPFVPRGGMSGPTRPVPVPESDHPCVSVYVMANSAATIQCMNSGVMIPYGALPYDATITACMQNEDDAIVDFGPHPLEFNGMVQIWFDLAGLDYSNDELASLAMWYVADDGALESIPMNIDMGSMRAMGRTNHFSRYILTRSD